MIQETHAAESLSNENAINRAFTKQSLFYDKLDSQNQILLELRRQVYQHVANFMKPQSKILELNAGTGIDALYFISHGHAVHATDLSEGMIEKIRQKIKSNDLSSALSCQQLSFQSLDKVSDRGPYDYVFSNFGGLNCCDDLSKITSQLERLLVPGAFVTWVIMPPVVIWETAGLLKGNLDTSLRRLKSKGTLAHVEGEYFRTHYHSLRQIKSSFPGSFNFVRSEGLAALTPPPHRNDFPAKHPLLFRLLTAADRGVRDHFPFNRWADHIIVTFQYRP